MITETNWVNPHGRREQAARVLWRSHQCSCHYVFFFSSQVWTTLCWSKLVSNFSTSAAAQVPLGPRLSIVEVSCAALPPKKRHIYRTPLECLLQYRQLWLRFCFLLFPPVLGLPPPRWDPSGQHQQFGALSGGSRVCSSRHQRSSGLQRPAAATGSWSTRQERLVCHQQTGARCGEGNDWTVRRKYAQSYRPVSGVQSQNFLFMSFFSPTRSVLSAQATLTRVCLESTPSPKLEPPVTWVSHGHNKTPFNVQYSDCSAENAWHILSCLGD